MKKRSEIEEKYKWDLELFKTEEEIEQVFNAFEYLTNETPKYYGKFNDKDKFFEYHTKFRKENILIGQFMFYISNLYSTDSSDTNTLKLIDRFTVAETKLSQASSFVDPQIDDLPDEYLQELLLDPRAKDLDNEIRDVIKNKKHKLDEKTTEIISKLSNAFSSSSTIHDLLESSEMPFKPAKDSSGKSHSVSSATYSSLVSSTDKTLRKNAFNSIMNGFGQFNKTMAELYIGNIKKEKDFNKLTNYKDSLESRLDDEDVPLSVFNNNLKVVTKNIPLMQDYISTKAAFSGLNKFAYYDLFKDEKISGNIDIEQAKTILNNALKPLGTDYISQMNRKLTDKSIDYLPNLNKSSGAYCSNQYQCKTLILMNWTDDFNSLSTLAHEMGHCINAEYFNSAQPYEKAGITIFAAEMASTVNEILLNHYMLQNCKKEHKLYYLNEFLDQVRSTIFRQTLFSEFELFAHNSVNADTPITYEDLNNKYFELCKKYYGKSCVIPKNLQYEWSRIPHFYRSFYVYSYSTGLITAICIANRILKDNSFAEKYIEFLKNGTNKPAVEILKEIGMDLTTETPFNEAFEFIEKRLTEYKNAIKCQ